LNYHISSVFLVLNHPEKDWAVFFKPMRRILLILLTFVCTLATVAQTNGAYYRVKNKKTARFIKVIDNRGSINLHTTDADLGALLTVKGDAFSHSDPSTVIKFDQMSSGWNLKCQGTNTYDIIGYPVMTDQTSRGTCAYAQKGTITKYLADSYDLLNLNSDSSRVKTAGGGDLESWWDILLVSPDGDNYFGLEPTISVGGSYYQTFYADFPFTFYSTEMEAYSVKTIDNSKAAVVIEPITGGVAAATPVIVKCSTNTASNNRLAIGSGSGAATGNLLTGVYFCNDVSEVSGHRNVVDYDASTMRVLGTAADGSLAFVKATSLQYIPANTAYITVTAGAPDVLKVYSQAEYDALPTAKTGDLNGDGEVSGQDLVIMVNMILGKRDKTAAADLSGDGDVSGVDYVKLVNLILGKN
jgi:hypothetical protein